MYIENLNAFDYEIDEQQKTILFGLKLKREELREEIKRLEKLRNNDFARRDFKMEKLIGEFTEIQQQIKRLNETQGGSE